MSLFVFNNQQKLIKSIPNRDLISVVQDQAINLSDTLFVEMPADIWSNLKEPASYLAVQDPYERFSYHMYKVSKHTTKADTTDIEAIQIGYDELKAYGYIKDRRFNNRPVLEAATAIVDGTDWQLGYVDTNLPNVNTNFYYISRLEALSKLIEVTGAEVRFRIEISGNEIIAKRLDLYKKLGTFKGKRFAYGSNLLEIIKEEDTSELYTALVGRGKGEETDTGGFGRRITFANIAWSKASGKSADKPLGQEFIELPEMTAYYGYPDGEPRTGIVEFGDIEEPELLLKATYERLVETSRPQVQFKAKVQTTGDMQLGEEVAIIRSDLDFRYKTRVFRVKRDYLNNMFTEVELGDKLTETLASRIKKIDTTNARREETIIQYIQTATNGKNKIFRSEIEPTEGMMVNDLWFKPIGGGEMEMYQWDGTIWELISSTLDTTKVQREVEAALAEAESAKQAAEQSFTDAITEAERLVTEQSVAFDAKFETETGAIRNEIEQGYTDAVAEAERLVTVQDTVYQVIFEGYDSAVGDLTGSVAEADSKATDALEQAGVSSSLAQTAKEASERAETSASQAHVKAEEAIVKADDATTKADDMLATIETFEPIVTDAQVKAEEAITKANGIPDTISGIIADKGLVSGDWVDTRIDDVTGEINYELTNVKGDIPDVIMGFEWNKVSDPTLVRTDYVEDYANLDEYNLKNAEFNLSIDGIKTNITTIEQTKLDTSTYSTFKNNEYANDVSGIRQRITHVETNKLDDEEFRTFKEHDYEVTVDGLSGKIQVIEDEKLDATEFDLFKSNDYQLTVDGFNMELSNISGAMPEYVLGVEWDRGSDPVFDRTDFMTESPTLSEYTVKTAEYDTSIDGLKVGLDQVQTKKLDGDIFTTFKSNDYDVTIGGLSGRILEVETDKLDTSDFNSFKSNDYEVTVAGFSGDITEIKRDKMNTSSFNTFKTNVFDATVNGLNGRIESVEFDKLDTSDFTNFKSNEYQTTVDGMAGQITAIERDKLDTVDFDSFKSNDYQLTVDGFNMELTNISGSVPDYVLGVEWYLSDDPTLIRTNYVEEVDLTNYDNPDYVMGIEWDGISNPSLTRTDNTEDLTSKKEFEVFLGDYNFSAEGWNATNTYVTNNKTQINNLISNASGWQQTISYVDANQTKFNETISQVDSYKQTIGSNGEKITQLVMTDDAFITTVSDLEGQIEGVSTQTSQLSDSWVLTIKSGSDIKTQINATTDGIRLESKLTHLAGDSLIDNAVIKSAHIDSLNVSKLTGTSAEFITLRSKVITADSITSEYLKVDNALVDKLTVNTAVVDRFFAKTAVTDNLSAKTLTAITANITSIRSQILVADVVESTHLKADTALIDKLFATTALIDTLTSKTAFINSVKAIEISADKVTTGELDAANVNIINLNVSSIVGLNSNFVHSLWNSNNASVSISADGLVSIGSDGDKTKIRNGLAQFWNNSNNLTGSIGTSYRTLDAEKTGVAVFLEYGKTFSVNRKASYDSTSYAQLMSFPADYAQLDLRRDLSMHNNNIINVGKITVQNGIEMSRTSIGNAWQVTFVNSTNDVGRVGPMSNSNDLGVHSAGALYLGVNGSGTYSSPLVVRREEVQLNNRLNANKQKIADVWDISFRNNSSEYGGIFNPSGTNDIAVVGSGSIFLSVGSASSSTTTMRIRKELIDVYWNINMNGKSVTGTSDARLKTNITPTNVIAIDHFRQFDFVDYNWIDTNMSHDRQFGLIAQHTPFISLYDKSNDLWLLDNSKQTMLNSLGIKELVSITDKHTSDILRIDTFIGQHEQEIKQLKQKIAELERKLA